MRAAERKRMMDGSSKTTLIDEIDELRKERDKWRKEFNAMRGVMEPDPPFYWMIGYFGWGSAEDDVDFIPGFDENPTPQAAVDAWEALRDKGETRAHDEAHYNENPRLLIYRVDEVGNAMTDRRWVFQPEKG